MAFFLINPGEARVAITATTRADPHLRVQRILPGDQPPITVFGFALANPFVRPQTVRPGQQPPILINVNVRANAIVFDAVRINPVVHVFGNPTVVPASGPPLWRQTIITQYDRSPTVAQLMANFAGYIDPTQDIDDFYNLMWNVDTAVGRGLDVWGRIVGIGRILSVLNLKFFGFDEQTPITVDPFNQSPFYSGQQLTSNFILDDPGFRTMVMAKAFANVCDGSIQSINRVLLTLFPHRGNCYVIDNGDMSMSYRFAFPLTPVEQSIVTSSGVLPKPTGVSVSVVVG